MRVFARPLTRREWLKLFLDVSIVAVAGLLANWFLFISPALAEQAQVASDALFFKMIYLPLDLGLASIALILLLRQPLLEEQQALRLLAFSALVLGLADMLAGYGLLLGRHTPGGSVEVAYVGGWILVGFAGVVRVRSPQPSAVHPDPAQSARSRWEQRSVFVGYVCLLLVGVFLAANGATSGLPESVSLVVPGLGLLIGLIFLRQMVMWKDSVQSSANLERELTERHRQVHINATMAQLASTLISAQSIVEISRLIVSEAKRLTESDLGFVGHVEPETGRLTLPAEGTDVWPGADLVSDEASLAVIRGLWGWVLANRRSLLTNDAAHDARSSRMPAAQLAINRFLSAPALAGEILVGQVAVANSSHAYDASDQVLIERLADLFALAVQRQQAADALARAKAELEERVAERTRDLVSANEQLRKEAMALDHAHQALRESESIYRALVETSPDGILLTDPEGQIVLCNQKLAVIAGLPSPQALYGRDIRDMASPEEREKMAAYAERLSRDGVLRDAEITVPRGDGSTAFISMNASVLTNAAGAISGLMAVVRDVTERKHVEDKLLYMSTHDALTGVYNRAYFEQEVQRLQRAEVAPVSVIIVDIDRFKQINDNFGHGAGDEALRRTAATLRRSFRGEDVVARIGGDEFCVLLPGADTSAAALAVQRMKGNMAVLNMTKGVPPLGLSVGHATAVKADRLDEALRRADARMYEDKVAHGVALRDARMRED
jgi:diguanylate cyclase (GGDEF)-like protein/PAS domain S-box-containing protein